MEHYLIFDSWCAVCSDLAAVVHRESKAILTPMGIHDSQAVDLLDRAFPDGWAAAPYLVHVEGARISAWTGISGALRLVMLLGPRATWRVWLAARRRGVQLAPGASTPHAAIRRRVGLKLSAGVAAGLTWLGLSPLEAFACTVCQDCPVRCQDTSCENLGSCSNTYYTCYDDRTGDPCWSGFDQRCPPVC